MFERLKHLSIKDPQVPGIFLLTCLTLVESIQILILIVFIFSFIPIQPNRVFYTIYPYIRDNLHPERDMFFYQIFVVLSIGIEAITLYVFRNYLSDRSFQKELRRFLLAELCWLGLLFFAIFKVLAHGQEVWTKYFFYVAVALAGSAKFFWPELKQAGEYVYSKMVQGNLLRQRGLWWDIGFVFILIALLFPDLEAVLSRVFNWDRFYHFDTFVMAPGWAHWTGNVLNIDVSTQYGALLPIVITGSTKILGGFSYPHAAAVIIGVTIIYFVICYGFLRVWLKSRMMAAFGVLLAIKLQMFQLGAAPLIWIYPSATMIRSFFDLVFLFFILKHSRELNPKFLWAAGACCGLSLALMLDTGVYLTLAFYAYLLLLLLNPHSRLTIFFSLRDLWGILRYILSPFFVFWGVLFFVQGPVIFKPVYWTNALEFINLFLHGWGALPVYFGLKDRQFFAFMLGLTIPVVYVWTMIVVGSLCLLRRIDWRNILVVIVCVYGLGLYHYFIYRSAVTSYHTVGIPFVLVICFWLQKFVQSFEERIQKNILPFLVIFALGALLTNSYFIYYPHIVNISGFNWKPEKKFYQEQFAFTKDAALIDRLTTTEDRVSVLSSFETKILMDAKRKPFFFYFPLFESRHMKGNQFGGTYIFTTERMKKILRQFEDATPEYVFVEKKLFLRQIPQEYYQHYETLSILLEYLNGHYEVSEEGEYLVALKRRIKS